MTRTLLTNAIILSDGGSRDTRWLLIEAGRIAALGTGRAPGAADQVIDLEGLILAPGMIDIHVHGALGHDTMDATPEALAAISRHLCEHGVTAYLATTMTASRDDTLSALRNVARVIAGPQQGARLLGAHLEGPYIDGGRSGSQDKHLVRAADPAEYHEWFATGAVRTITLTPESPQAHELIRYALAQGATVSAGHTRATHDEMRAAADQGVSRVTHLFNAMEPLHHRLPGVVGAALSLDALSCELIADTVHVHPAVLKLVVRAKGLERVILVSDAMSGTGMPDGVYALGGQEVTVADGVARIASGALAGSTLTLDLAVHNIMAATDLALPRALCMAAATPAQAIGLFGAKGSIAVGKDADLAVIDDQVRVHMTFVAGERVFCS